MGYDRNRDRKLTVKGKSAELTFAVDASTKVTATGASHKSESMKDAKTAQITGFVHNGDTVTVKYEDSGDKKIAKIVQVRRSAALPTK